MRPNLLIILASLAVPAIAWCADPQTGTGKANGKGGEEPFTLVWQDLFDSGELNPLRWNVEVNNSGGGNNELQYYTDRPENVRVGDDGQGNSCLILTARREEYKGRHFTSGRVNSLGLVAFKHGKIEAAIKLPKTANGLWPAFWMMGNDYGEVGWPKSGETDIMEFGHSNGISAGSQERYFNGACHWGQGWPAASYANHVTRAYSLQDGQFHIFTCIWDENEVRMYVDLDKMPVQTPYFRMTMPCDDPDNEWSPGNYFHKLNFILFNLAIGGNFPGIHDAAGITALNNENGQQASMYVNYVKIYQKGSADEDQYFVVPSDSLEGYDDDENGDGIADSFTDEYPIIDIYGNANAPEGQNIAVFDLAGRLCLSTQANRLSLDLLPAGIYLVRAGNKTVKYNHN